MKDYVKLTKVSETVTGTRQGLRATYKKTKELLNRCNTAVENVINEWIRER